MQVVYKAGLHVVLRNTKGEGRTNLVTYLQYQASTDEIELSRTVLVGAPMTDELFYFGPRPSRGLDETTI